MSQQPTVRGFTLIELMVVIAIMGIVMSMGVPAIYHLWRKESLRKTASDLQEVCSNARARAILQGVTTEVVFHPQDGRFELSGGGTNGVAPPNSSASSGSGLSGQIPPNVALEMLDVNLTECKDFDQVPVHFYPNGTCDEMTVILRALDSHSENDQIRIITTEVTTGLTSIETDPRKLLSLKQ